MEEVLVRPLRMSVAVFEIASCCGYIRDDLACPNPVVVDCAMMEVFAD
jgi:hypothetical protein